MIHSIANKTVQCCKFFNMEYHKYEEPIELLENNSFSLPHGVYLKEIHYFGSVFLKISPLLRLANLFGNILG